MIGKVGDIYGFYPETDTEEAEEIYEFIVQQIFAHVNIQLMAQDVREEEY